MGKQEKLATPTELLEQLPEFEGLPTLEVSLEVRGIEGGLNEGLTIAPVVKHKGDRVYLLIEGTVDAILHKGIADRDGWRRAHVIRVDTGTIVDADFAEERLEAHALRLEEARGVQRLPFDEALAGEHEAGEHADGLVEGCAACDEEIRAKASEAVDSLEEFEIDDDLAPIDGDVEDDDAA